MRVVLNIIIIGALCALAAFVLFKLISLIAGVLQERRKERWIKKNNIRCKQCEHYKVTEKSGPLCYRMAFAPMYNKRGELLGYLAPGIADGDELACVWYKAKEEGKK